MWIQNGVVYIRFRGGEYSNLEAWNSLTEMWECRAGSNLRSGLSPLPLSGLLFDVACESSPTATGLWTLYAAVIRSHR